MSLTLLTATGARPEAFAICEQLMLAQDYADPVRWVIVDDGPEEQPVTFCRPGWALEIVRPVALWKPGGNTQARNLAEGLSRIEDHEWVVLIEDDDHYGAGYLSAVADWLKSDELVGESRARYYNIGSRRGYQMHNENHASLCSTAVKGEGLKALRESVHRACTFIDLDLWQAPVKKALYATHYVVGIKGLPGRGGIGCGHDPSFGSPMDLQDWLGDAAAMYSELR